MFRFLVICSLISSSFKLINTNNESTNTGDFWQDEDHAPKIIQGDSVLSVGSNGSYAHLIRNKRSADVVFGAIGAVTDIIGIIQQAEANKMMEENFRDIASKLDQSLNSINNVQDTMDQMMQKSMDAFHILQERFDQNTDEIIAEIDNVGKKVDRNSGYLLNILRTTSNTYNAVERTRLEMRAGFNNALSHARNTAIKPKLTKMSNFVTYFDNQKALISQKSRGEMIAALKDDKGFLPHLRRSRTPDGENLQVVLNEIMQEQYAIPTSANDTLAYAALSSMYYGVTTYISMLRYLIRANIFLADHYLRGREIENFNGQVGQMIDDFESFRDTLNGKSGLIDQAVKIMKEASNKDFTFENSHLDLLGWSNNLKTEKFSIIHTRLPIIHSVPDKLTVQFNFDHSLPTPLGSWEDGVRVSYAVQYRDGGGLYSKVGAWSEPFTVKGKANPILIVPAQATYTRLLFRKFDDEKPQFVGTLDRESQTEFRDINRDLYNAASGLHQSAAIVEATNLINCGASIRATFELSRCAIHAAAENGNTLLASRLLMNDTNSFNIKDINDYTTLHVAAESGWSEFVVLMLNHGFDINAKTKDGSTALHLAVAKGHSKVVDALLNAKYPSDINAQDNSGARPLHIAVRNGAEHLVKILLDDERTNVNLESRGNLTPLHVSSMMNCPEITEKLLNVPGISIDARSVGNLTALHHAVISRNFKALKLLAAHVGADINAQSNNGWSPLHYAVTTKEKQIVTELLKLKTPRNLKIDVFDIGHTTPLHLAAASGQRDVVEGFLDCGAQIDLQNKRGHTALYLATLNKHYEVLAILLSKGANTNLKTIFGASVLHLVSSVGDNRSLQKLLDMGHDIDIDLTDKGGLTALHLAAVNNHLSVAEALLKKGANANARTKNGSTALHISSSRGNVEMVKCILKSVNVRINAMNDMKITPLSLAEQANHTVVVSLLRKTIEEVTASLLDAARTGKLNDVKLLANRLADEEGSNSEGKTPLMCASEQGHEDVVRYLVKINADMEAKDKYGRTPLWLAANSGHLDVVRYLVENGADINSNDVSGDSPLQAAMVDGKSMNAAAYLVESGADLQLKDCSLLVSAARAGPIDLVKALVKTRGVDVNCKTQHAFPLLLAVQRNDIDKVKFLVEHGARVKPFGWGGVDARDWAWVLNDKEIYKYLSNNSKV